MSANQRFLIGHGGDISLFLLEISPNNPPILHVWVSKPPYLLTGSLNPPNYPKPYKLPPLAVLTVVLSMMDTGLASSRTMFQCRMLPNVRISARNPWSCDAAGPAVQPFHDDHPRRPGAAGVHHADATAAHHVPVLHALDHLEGQGCRLEEG